MSLIVVSLRGLLWPLDLQYCIASKKANLFFRDKMNEGRKERGGMNELQRDNAHFQKVTQFAPVYVLMCIRFLRRMHSLFRHNLFIALSTLALWKPRLKLRHDIVTLPKYPSALCKEDSCRKLQGDLLQCSPEIKSVELYLPVDDFTVLVQCVSRCG